VRLIYTELHFGFAAMKSSPKN